MLFYMGGLKCEMESLFACKISIFINSILDCQILPKKLLSCFCAKAVYYEGALDEVHIHTHIQHMRKLALIINYITIYIINRL